MGVKVDVGGRSVKGFSEVNSRNSSGACSVISSLNCGLGLINSASTIVSYCCATSTGIDIGVSRLQNIGNGCCKSK